ncbi:MAG: hypothetical protein ACK5PS_13855 [Desulfopila sp.]
MNGNVFTGELVAQARIGDQIAVIPTAGDLARTPASTPSSSITPTRFPAVL